MATGPIPGARLPPTGRLETFPSHPGEHSPGAKVRSVHTMPTLSLHRQDLLENTVEPQPP